MDWAFPAWANMMMAAGAGGMAAYVAIRADLAALKAQIVIFEASLSRAHERIDDLQRRDMR